MGDFCTGCGEKKDDCECSSLFGNGGGLMALGAVIGVVGKTVYENNAPKKADSRVVQEQKRRMEEQKRRMAELKIENKRLTEEKKNTVKKKVGTQLCNSDDEDGICSICLDLKSDMMFLPCQHVATCQSCSEMMENCPICRAKIDDKIRAFFS